MAYLGNAPAEKYISFERQVFTIVNSQTAYTLDHSVTNENDIRLVVNNIVQEPGSGKAYTASGTTLTLSAALVNGTDEMYCVFLGRAVGTVNAPAASVGTSQLASDAVTEAKIADDAVESEHLNDNVISGQTELAVAPASTDELLISDGGVLKRVDVSLVGGITMVDQWRLTTSFTGNADPIASNWERNDTTPLVGYYGAQMTESSGVFSFPSTGIYYVSYHNSFSLSGSSRYNFVRMQTTTNNGSNWSTVTRSYAHISQVSSDVTYSNVHNELVIDVTDTSNIKMRFGVEQHNTSTTTMGDTDSDLTYLRFIKLAET